MVQRERALKTIFSDLASAEYSPSVVHEDVNTGLVSGNFGADPLCLTHFREISVVDCVSAVWSDIVETVHGSFAPSTIASHLDDLRPLAASLSAAAWPMPLVDPVITTTLWAVGPFIDVVEMAGDKSRSLGELPSSHVYQYFIRKLMQGDALGSTDAGSV